MDWHRDGRLDTYRYVLVDPATRQEKDLITSVTSCQVVLAALTDLKVSGTIGHYGAWDAYVDQLMRVYQVSTLAGETVEVPWCTCRIVTGGESWHDGSKDGTADLVSVLGYLSASEIPSLLTVPAGTVAVSYAAAVCTGKGLPVVATPSSLITSKPLSWDAGTSWLTVVNDLLTAAGYSSAGVDPYGRITMTPYVDPASRTPVWDYGQESTISPERTHEFDMRDVPNDYVVTYSSQDVTLSGHAVNTDPTSRYSTVSRGYTITRTESVSDVATDGATTAQIQAVLDSLAATKLATATSAVESWTVTHPYAPVVPNDAVTLPVDGEAQIMAVTTVTRTAIPGARCETKMRRFIRK